MTEFRNVLMLASLGILVQSQPIVASPINGSFEAGSFAGWQLEMGRGFSPSNPRGHSAGSAAVVSEWSQPNGLSSIQKPVAGQMFAVLSTEAAANFSGNRNYQILLRQQVVLGAHEGLSGWAAFYNGDFEPQDAAWVKIWDATGQLVATPWQENSGLWPERDHNTTSLYNTSPWQQWTWTAPQDGSYTLGFGMTTRGDNTHASYGFFDDFQKSPLAAPVPEPSSLTLAILGAGLLARFHRPKPRTDKNYAT